MDQLKLSTAIDVLWFAFDGNGDGVTGIADGSWTKRIAKGGSTFAAMTVTITERENGWYHLQLSTSHTDTLGYLAVSLSATGVKRVNMLWRVSARLEDDLATQTSVDTIDDFLDTEILAIKAKTDQLTFTNANKVDSAILAAGDFAQAAADKVWGSATRTLTALGASLVQEIWDRATSALTTAGSIGKLLVDNINATMTSRASQTSVDTIDDIIDTEIPAILAAVDTEVAAIKAVTDLLPNGGALNNLDAAISSRATPAQVNAEVLDVLNVDTFAQPGQEAPAATTTLALMIRYLYKLMRNRVTQTSTTFSVYADNESTVDHKATVSDNGTVFDRTELVSGP